MCFIDSGQRFVIIADPGVPTGEPAGTYPPFEDGEARGVWVLDGRTGEPLLGKFPAEGRFAKRR